MKLSMRVVRVSGVDQYHYMTRNYTGIRTLNSRKVKTPYPDMSMATQDLDQLVCNGSLTAQRNQPIQPLVLVYVILELVLFFF